MAPRVVYFEHPDEFEEVRDFVHETARALEFAARARKVERFLSQPFHVAEIFTGKPGKFVSLDQTIAGFKGLLTGQYDDLPEQAFYMVGPIEEAVEKAEAMAKEAE